MGLLGSNKRLGACSFGLLLLLLLARGWVVEALLLLLLLLLLVGIKGSCLQRKRNHLHGTMAMQCLLLCDFFVAK
jgi:hypothetical protein